MINEGNKKKREQLMESGKQTSWTQSTYGSVFPPPAEKKKKKKKHKTPLQKKYKNQTEWIKQKKRQTHEKRQ